MLNHPLRLFDSLRTCLLRVPVASVLQLYAFQLEDEESEIRSPRLLIRDAEHEVRHVTAHR